MINWVQLLGPIILEMSNQQILFCSSEHNFIRIVLFFDSNIYFSLYMFTMKTSITEESFTLASSQSIMSKYTNLDSDFGFTGATINNNSSSITFEFNFTNSIVGSKINAAIVALAPCDNNNSAFEIKDGASRGSIIGSEVSGTSTATIRRNIESDIHTKKGSILLNYCLRADLYDTMDDSFSLGAKKVNLHLNVTYETEGTFSISSIETSEFTGTNINSESTRSITIKVFRDACTGCEVVGNDANSCFTINRLAVGDILALCLKGEATDMELIGLKSATVQAGEYVSPVVSSDGRWHWKSWG